MTHRADQSGAPSRCLNHGEKPSVAPLWLGYPIRPGHEVGNPGPPSGWHRPSRVLAGEATQDVNDRERDKAREAQPVTTEGEWRRASAPIGGIVVEAYLER